MKSLDGWAIALMTRARTVYLALVFESILLLFGNLAKKRIHCQEDRENLMTIAGIRQKSFTRVNHTMLVVGFPRKLGFRL